MLDTSTVILLGQISDPTELPDESVISAITLAELSVGPHVALDDAAHVVVQDGQQPGFPARWRWCLPLAPWRRRCVPQGANRRRERMTRSSLRARSRTHCRSTHATQPTSQESRGLRSGRSPTRITSRADAT